VLLMLMTENALSDPAGASPFLCFRIPNPYYGLFLASLFSLISMFPLLDLLLGVGLAHAREWQSQRQPHGLPLLPHSLSLSLSLSFLLCSPAHQQTMPTSLAGSAPQCAAWSPGSPVQAAWPLAQASAAPWAMCMRPPQCCLQGRGMCRGSP
jgi:hypothetical protein